MDKGIESIGIKRARSSSISSDETLSSKRHEATPLFLIDTEPDPLVNTAAREGAFISYTYIDLSPSDPTAILAMLGEAIEPPIKSSSRACFNCSSIFHVSSVCPESKNHQLIAINRKRFDEEHGQTGEGRRLGDDSDRSRRLNYTDQFRAGVVGDDLRYALGFGRAQESERVVEYPWYYRFSEFGYPQGWTMRHGARDPRDLVKDRIGRDIDWENVELLSLYHGEEDDSSTAPTDCITTLGTPLPPPLPPGPLPPPPPSGPPPPPTIIRLIHYPSNLFDSSRLSIYQPGYLLPRPPVLQFEQQPRYHQSVALPPVVIEPEESEGEMEMEMESEED